MLLRLVQLCSRKSLRTMSPIRSPTRGRHIIGITNVGHSAKVGTDAPSFSRTAWIVCVPAVFREYSSILELRKYASQFMNCGNKRMIPLKYSTTIYFYVLFVELCLSGVQLPLVDSFQSCAALCA